MGRRRSSGNPFTKGLSKAIDKVAPEVLDNVMDVATGPRKHNKKTSKSSNDTTDWHTRAPAAPRKRRVR